MARWGKISARGKVEDRRGLGRVVGGIGATGVIALLLLSAVTGADPAQVLGQLQEIAPQQEVESGQFAGQDEYEVFASTVLGSNNQAWEAKISGYSEPTLVLFREAVDSACGTASSAVGPFYCPYDSTIYLDETFFDELTNRFGARGGDVAQAYVIAHEVGHHVQNETGYLSAQGGSIEKELQADCLAGIWANTIADRGILEEGEIEEAIDAAAAVGDDRIQKRVQGYVNPETWTHGSSAQRVDSFKTGYTTGSLNSCGIER